MNLQKISAKLLPPAIAWRLDKGRRESEETEKFKRIYAHFLKSGDLSFDIGANLGSRVRAFRSLGCRVVAVEPQPDCFKKLTTEFGADTNVELYPMAVSAEAGEIDLRLSPDHVLATTSLTFISTTQSSGRFAEAVWNRVLRVGTTTLDVLIQKHGMPAFVKIDVEGGEPQVLAGLSRPVPALSIEWVPELPQHSIDCIDKLESLAAYEYNISWAETMRFSARGWRDAEAMRLLIKEFAGETFLFGDIYARMKAP
jgi:FkbM family methyltransferase